MDAISSLCDITEESVSQRILHEQRWNNAGTTLEQCWNNVGTMYEQCSRIVQCMNNVQEQCMNILSSLNDWTLSMHNHRSVVIAYIDFQRAFDAIS